jgi:flavin reductase (DIM6/NTAB) family NADH-FMN oxidoreductase RutF
MAPFICDNEDTGGRFVNSRACRKTLRLLPYVMTSRSGDRHGAVMVPSLSKASFRPPLIMAGVRKDSIVYKCMSCTGCVAIHVFGRDQPGSGKAVPVFNPVR